MNYYQSLNTNNKIYFLKYQICKLEKIVQNYFDDYSYYVDNNEPEEDNHLLDELIDETEEKIRKVKNLLKQKQLKLKLTKKYYESF